MVLFCGMLGQFVLGQAVTEFEERDLPELKDRRLENLSNTLVNLTTAYDEKDLLKITDLFNREDIESMGGREMYAEWVGLLGSASERTLAKFGSAEKVDSANGKWFGVISFRMETRMTKSLRVIETCLVGISSDDGKTWRFKTGESFFRDYNELVGAIPVIERRETETSIEQ